MEATVWKLKLENILWDSFWLMNCNIIQYQKKQWFNTSTFSLSYLTFYSRYASQLEKKNPNKVQRLKQNIFYFIFYIISNICLPNIELNSYNNPDP